MPVTRTAFNRSSVGLSCSTSNSTESPCVAKRRPSVPPSASVVFVSSSYLPQTSESFHLQRALMDEYIGFTIVRRDVPESLGAVEPLHLVASRLYDSAVSRTRKTNRSARAPSTDASSERPAPEPRKRALKNIPRYPSTRASRRDVRARHRVADAVPAVDPAKDRAPHRRRLRRASTSHAPVRARGGWGKNYLPTPPRARLGAVPHRSRRRARGARGGTCGARAGRIPRSRGSPRRGPASYRRGINAIARRARAIRIDAM